MSNNHPAPTEPVKRRLGSDPFGDVQHMIQAAAAPDTDHPATPAEPARVRSDATGAPDSLRRLRGQPETIGLTQKSTMVACPYLGVVEDPHTRFLQPDPVHRCYGTHPSSTIELDYQTDFCLAAQFVSCETYVEVQERDVSVQGETKVSLKGFLARLFRRR